MKASGYLDRVDRLRTRLRGTSLRARRLTVVSVVYLIVVAITVVSFSSVATVASPGDRSPVTIYAPRTIEHYGIGAEADVTVQEGDPIVSEGETVTTAQYELLRSLGYIPSGYKWLNVLYVMLVVFVMFGLVGMFLARKRRSFYDSPGMLAMLGAMVILYTVVTKVLMVVSVHWSPFWQYLVPTAAVAMVTAILFDWNVAVIVLGLCAMLAGLVSGGNFQVVAFALVGGLFPAIFASRESSRHELRRIGLYTCFWLALAAFSVSLLNAPAGELPLNLALGFLNGAICGIVVMGTLPFLETTFRVTTNTWLLELASPEQELLKELSVKAPGTYSHSVMVANLSEAAARAIGSDPMFARVAAYYHDVGKMKRPQFFVENQQPGQNPHDRISPNLSAIILTSHVRDGVEMLEENHIPPDIVETIREHHGTGVIRYFYERAVETEEKGPVEESRFRYHYDRPRRKTAGILMLADAVEATARTLTYPSATAIEQMVNRIVNGKLEDGQLDDCDLTFSDLSKIKTAFAKVLISTYHPRVDYPVKVISSGGRRKDGDKDNARRPSTAQVPAAEKSAEEDAG